MKKFKIIMSLILLVTVQNFSYAQIIESGPGIYTIDEGCGSINLTQSPFSGVAATPLCEQYVCPHCPPI